MTSELLKNEPYSILVAHHEDEIRTRLRKTLRAAGYPQIAIAQSGRNTINQLLRDNYHLLIIPRNYQTLTAGNSYA